MRSSSGKSHGLNAAIAVAEKRFEHVTRQHEIDFLLASALEVGKASRLDHTFLPDVHNEVHDAILGQRVAIAQDALAILETDTVAANVRAAELALKGTAVRLIELRFAEYEMSGKAISIFNGELYDVQAAMELAGEFLRGRKEYVQHRIICRPHEALTQHLADGTRFAASNPRELEGEEVS